MAEGKDDATVFCWKKFDPLQYAGALWPYVREKALSHGDRTALVNPYTQEEYSCSRIVSLAEQLSRGMRKLGIAEGACVCLFAPNCAENVLIVHATLATGATLHPANTSISSEELRRQLEISGAVMVFTSAGLLQTVRHAMEGTRLQIVIIGPPDGNLNFEDLMTLGTQDVTLPVTFADPEESISWIIFSSGTSGLPKAVELTQRNIRAWITIYFSTPGCLNTGESIVSFLPVHHVSGLTSTVAYLVGGIRLVFMSSVDLDLYLTFVQQYKVSFLYLAPPLLTALVKKEGVQKYDLSHVRCVFCGGLALSPGVEKQFQDKFGIPVAQVYGLSEVMGLTGANNGRKPGSVGLPFPGVELKVLDVDTGRSLGENQAGELCVRSPFLTKGYHKDPERTRQAIDPQGWLHTGDMAKVDEDGFLYIVDRLREIIRVKEDGGVRIMPVAPGHIEDILLQHPSVADAAVVGVLDDEYGEVPMAFVVAKPEATLTEQEVLDTVRENAPSHMQIRGGVEFRTSIPRSPIGKILRRQLKDEFEKKVKERIS